GVGPGDEVLMPSFAFVSQANAILQRGATPVFCEIDPDTLNLDPDDAARRLTPRSKLLLPVHYAGVACELASLQALAKEHDLQLLEDAAQGIGAHWRGQHLGTVGDAGFLSFHETKNLVAGEGGAFLTRDPELLRAAEVIQEKGTNRSAFLRGEGDKYTWVGPGGSFVLSDLLAALLEVQLERVETLTRARMRVWNRYHDGLVELEDAEWLRRPRVPADCQHNAHIYALRAANPDLRDRLLKGLRAAGIGATFHFQPLHASPYARRHLGTADQRLPVTDDAAETLVRLPLWSGLTVAQADRVVDEVRRLCTG
ncbi:MAG: dTDP-4-amino-4,6-dideoxygalactose transaminase, partial [Proteobacteria bacterium]|nr:dTDP-4-amino-4,6-dideoxygalactose transaminase [Pseudomonadota bacterium]